MSDMLKLQKKIFAKLAKPTLAAVATVTKDGKPWARYVMVYADKDLNIAFSTFKGSRKVSHLRKNSDVHVLCGATTVKGTKAYLQIQGKARISTDPKVKRAHWNPGLKAYFSGPSDPNYVVVLVQPSQIEYQSMKAMGPEVWDAKAAVKAKKAAAKKPAKKKAAKKRK